MEVKAAVLEEPGAEFSVGPVDLDEPRGNEVLVKVVATGICHTDLSVRDQYYPVPLPAVLGHEGAGIVERVGTDVTKVKEGDHVVLSFHSCGACGNCKQGAPGYCVELFGHNFGGARPDGSPVMHRGDDVVHGAFFGQSSFADYALAFENNVVKVREDAPLEMLGPLGCGIQTGAGTVLNNLHPKAGQSIAVFGVGTVGLSSVMAAKIAGCDPIIAVDLNAKRLELAAELGATHTINASDANPVEAIHELTGGGANYSVEATGVPEVVRQSVDALGLQGICGLLGTSPLGTEVTLDMNAILFGRTVRGVIEGDAVPDLFIPQMVDMYMAGKFPIDRLMEFYNLDQINEAVAATEGGGTVKPILRMG